MKYYRYTFVDSDTNIPVSVEPALSGPMLPEETTFLFSLESSFLTGVPIFFGKLSKFHKCPDWFEEYDEKQLIEILKRELIERLNKKLEEKLNTNKIDFEDKLISCSSENIANLQQILNLKAIDESVDLFYFKHENCLSKVYTEDVKQLLCLINNKIQKLYEWAFILSESISSDNDLLNLLKTSNLINE